jgi:hypothetical protein
MTLSKYFFSAALAFGATIVTASAAMADKGENSGPAVAAGVAPATASGDRWAVIGSGCIFSRGKGVVSVTRGDSATGSCVVRFNKNVTGCVYVGTIGLPGSVGVSPPGEITVVRRNSVPQAVYVATYNSAGTQTDRGFHLLVGCG